VSYGIDPTSPLVGSVTKVKDYRYGTRLNFDSKCEDGTYETFRWYPIQIDMTGNRMTCQVDGKVVAEYSDNADWYRSGAIALVCRGTSVIHFRDILIQEFAGAEKKAPGTIDRIMSDGDPGNPAAPSQPESPHVGSRRKVQTRNNRSTAAMTDPLQ